MRAAELYAAVIADSARFLGQDDKLTIASRDGAAYEIGKAGDPIRATASLRELLKDIETHNNPRELWGTRYRLAYWTTEAGDYAEALRLWEQVVAEALEDYGRLHLWSLDARAQHADCVGAAGDPSRAAQMLEEVRVDASRLDSLPSTNVLRIARLLATWTGKAGNPDEAIRQLKRLTAIATEQRGTDDSWTLSLRQHLAHWTGEAGDPL